MTQELFRSQAIATSPGQGRVPLGALTEAVRVQVSLVALSVEAIAGEARAQDATKVVRALLLAREVGAHIHACKEGQMELCAAIRTTPPMRLTLGVKQGGLDRSLATKGDPPTHITVPCPGPNLQPGSDFSVKM